MAVNLYPPIVDTYMPAFIVSELQGDCKIYFSLSKYNSLSEIQGALVNVSNQYTNESVLSSPVGIKGYSTIGEDTTRSGDDKYYITLTKNDIQNGWTLNQLYKVQIRFSAVPINEITTDWLIQNEQNFSEWSTVCLIQGITKPTLVLNNFAESEVGEETIFTSMNNVIAGKVEFEDNEELESYRFFLYKREDLDSAVFDSGIVYTEPYNPNEINYFLKYGLIDGESYFMKFTYTTKSGYSETYEYSFTIIDGGGEPLDARISAEADEDQGCITIKIQSDKSKFIGNLTIRRASSDTNFTIWEDVHTTPIFSDGVLNFTWRDYTVESGVWYKYCAQKRNAYGDRGLIIQIANPVMITLQDMFLTKADKQLKIKFNPQVTNFKHTVSDAMTQTLGSKYPFIKRNGSVDFRQFSISGLISHFTDEEKNFMSENELYKNRKDLYDTYNEEYRISEYNDFTLERTFREKVMEFLYANDIKLFRSPSEGNILIRLMNISLTPEATLGRMIYSFSAEAIEIDEISFENFEKYEIQKVGTYSSQILREYEETKQYQGIVRGNFVQFVTERANDIKEEGIKKTVSDLTSVKIAIQSEPYLIDIDSNPMRILTGDDKSVENSYLGYLIKINGNEMLIPKHGILQLDSTNVSISSLEFLNNEEVILDYTYSVKEEQDITKIPKQIVYSTKVGQIYSPVTPELELIELIKSQFTVEKDNWYQSVFEINNIQIEAEPGTVIYLRDTGGENFKRLVIGDTGYLNIEDNDFSIDKLYFMGEDVSRYSKEGKNITDRKWIDKKDSYLYIEQFNEYGQPIKKPKVSRNTTEDGVELIAAKGEVINPVERGVYYIADTKVPYDDLKYDEATDQYLLELSNMWNELYYNTDEKGNKIRPVLRSGIFMQGNWYPFYEGSSNIYGSGEVATILKPTFAIVNYTCEVERGEY